MLKNFFKKRKREGESSNNQNVLVAALLIHAAKMDENYTDKEKSIILKALSEISDEKENNLNIILEEALKIIERRDLDNQSLYKRLHTKI